MSKRLTTEEFINNAKKVHGDKYNYDKVNYINNKSPITITCPIHGDFEQIPNTHLSGCGCPECGKIQQIDKQSLSLEEFVERARKVHGDKYDYSKTEYINNHTPITIICPIHGEFQQLPMYHLSGYGCSFCGGTRRLSTSEFIEAAKKIHGDKYDYSKINYVNMVTPITIICPIHGEFQQPPKRHIIGCGCPECGKESAIQNRTTTLEEFIEKAREVHGDKYNYDKVNYINRTTKVLITCPTHGDFKQTPGNHLNGQGCPICNCSKLETNVRQYLSINNIPYEEQKTWDWLVYKKHQHLDFYLPELNIAIECQGIQHFRENEVFDLRESLTERINRDINKQRLCLENKIVIYYYSNLSSKNNRFNYPYLVFEDMNELIQIAISSNPLWIN